MTKAEISVKINRCRMQITANNREIAQMEEDIYAIDDLKRRVETKLSNYNTDIKKMADSANSLGYYKSTNNIAKVYNQKGVSISATKILTNSRASEAIHSMQSIKSNLMTKVGALRASNAYLKNQLSFLQREYYLAEE